MIFGGFQMEGVSFELTIQGSTRLESRDPRRFGVEIATFPGPGTAIWSGNSNVSGPPGPGFRGENHGKPNGFSMVFWPETLLFPLQMASKIEKKNIKNQSFFNHFSAGNVTISTPNGLPPPEGPPWPNLQKVWQIDNFLTFSPRVVMTYTILNYTIVYYFILY